jgi:hypothetical protein
MGEEQERLKDSSSASNSLIEANHGWQIKHFVLAGVFGAMTFVVAFALGSGIILATGIPATGGLVNIFAAVLLMIIGIRIVPRFGFATLAMTIMFSIAIPTIIGGPPGVYKVVSGILIGLSFDIVASVLGRTRWAFVIAGSFASIISLLCVYFALLLLQLPGIERLEPLLKFLIPVQAINGALGAIVANFLFEKRLKNISAIQRLMN